MQENTTNFGYKTIPVAEKTERVQEVFHSVAKRYDLMNDLMSFGLHRLWKKMAVSRLSVRPNHHILDLAGGTGDLTELIIPQLCTRQGKIILSDLNQSMLDEGIKRFLDKGIIKPVEYIQANAEQLPFANDSFHGLIIAFGLRNITHQLDALKEMYRVIKPGGRVVILEFSKPIPVLSKIYDAYSFTALPMLGKLCLNDSASYQYLAESIRKHPDQETLKAMIEDANFKRVTYQNLSGGITAIHCGFKML